REKRFLLLTAGFILFAASPAVQMFTPTLDELSSEPDLFPLEVKLFFIAGEICMIAGIYLLAVIFISYTSPIIRQYAWTGLIITIIIPIILYPFLDFELTFYLTQIIMLIIIMGLVLYIIYSRKPLQDIAKNVPLFFTITIVTGIMNIILTLPLFDYSELIMTLELVTRIGVSFLVPFVYVHLEYNLVAVEKDTLKDRYSHDLAQLVQVASARLHLMSKNDEISEEVKTTLEKVQSDHMKIGELIKLIRKI
ncbi:MAG: hypothetical protein ACFFD4_33820, partial [Candidatus Odinarchaeota archaeon]